jgi:hypothetical protein
VFYQRWQNTPGFSLGGLADHQHAYQFFGEDFDFLKDDFHLLTEGCENYCWSFYFCKPPAWLLMQYFQQVIAQQYPQDF